MIHFLLLSLSTVIESHRLLPGETSCCTLPLQNSANQVRFVRHTRRASRLCSGKLVRDLIICGRLMKRRTLRIIATIVSVGPRLRHIRRESCQRIQRHSRTTPAGVVATINNNTSDVLAEEPCTSAACSQLCQSSIPVKLDRGK